jgi:hypothetical protein
MRGIVELSLQVLDAFNPAKYGKLCGMWRGFRDGILGARLTIVKVNTMTKRPFWLGRML